MDAASGLRHLPRLGKSAMSELYNRNRRRHYRKRGPADVLAVALELESGEWVPADLSNTSAGGLGVELVVAPRVPRSGEHVTVRLGTGIAKRPLEIPTVVRFVRLAERATDGDDDTFVDGVQARIGLEIRDVDAFYSRLPPPMFRYFNRRALGRLPAAGTPLTMCVMSGIERVDGEVLDLSVAGACVKSELELPVRDGPAQCELTLPGARQAVAVAAHLVYRHVRDGMHVTGLRFDPDSATFGAFESAVASYVIAEQRTRGFDLSGISDTVPDEN